MPKVERKKQPEHYLVMQEKKTGPKSIFCGLNRSDRLLASQNNIFSYIIQEGIYLKKKCDTAANRKNICLIVTINL